MTPAPAPHPTIPVPFLAALALALLGGCSSTAARRDIGAGGATAGGAAALVAVSAEPAGANCAAGGTRIDAGLDADGDGTLSAGEVAVTQYACNGAAGATGATGASGADGAGGLTTLLAISTEPAGPNCAYGGTRVTSGLDVNGNAALDAGEITTSRYACDGAPGANGTNGTNGADGLTTLLLVTVEAPGGNCAAGGSKVQAGADADRDGVLDAGEVTSTQVMCNGAAGAAGSAGPAGSNGLAALVRMVDEPAGSNCASGGKKVLAGLDASGNGSLEDGEVTSTSYVCNGAAGATGASGATGATGATGADGFTTLLAISTEPAGANCTSGGVRVSSGLDASRDGVLDPGEISTTRYLCSAPPVFPWVDVTAAAVQAQPNSGYLADAAAQVAVTLPANAALVPGDVVRVNGIGAGGWRVAQNAGQTIQVSSLIQPYTFLSRDAVRGWNSVASSADGRALVAAAWNDQLYTSADGGTTWTARESARNWYALASSADGTKLVAGVYGGYLYASADGGATWTPRATDSSRNWRGIASSADGTKLVAVGQGQNIFLSTDGGVTWTPSADPMNSVSRGWIAVASSADGSRLAAAENGGYLYTSTDGGASWTQRDSARFWSSVASSADGTRLVAAVEWGQLYTSADGGASWTPSGSSGLDWFSVASSAAGTRLVAAARGNQLYTSTDSGATWTARDFTRGWYAVATSSDGDVIAAVADANRIQISSPWSTFGAGGGLSGDRYEAVELQYLGGGQFGLLSSAGSLTVQ